MSEKQAAEAFRKAIERAEYFSDAVALRSLAAEVVAMRGKLEALEALPRTPAREDPTGYPVLTVRAADIDRILGRG